MIPASIPTTLEDLRARWVSLHDLDRAKAIKGMRDAGNSVRFLAKELGVSEALLRNLLDAAKAPLPDRMLARRGKISTRELVKRQKLWEKAETEKTRASEEQRRTKEAKAWSTRIRRWLQELNLPWEHQWEILDLTRRELDEAEYKGILPRPVVQRLPLEEIIEQTRPHDSRWSPKNSRWQPADEIYFFVEWLGLWTLAAIQDRIIQDAALGDALSTTQRREPVQPASP
jgi:lambda repressor-like predicted transcriptional regulator